MEKNHHNLSLPLPIPLTTWQTWVGEIVFWLLAVLVPLVGHTFHWNVRAVLPMHWVILLAALVYGQKGGLFAGILSPALNTLLTGMPAPHLLPLLTLEIGTYGFVAGTLREKARWNSFVCLFLAIVMGRLVYLGYSFLFRTYKGDFFSWAWQTLSPGFLSAILQIIFLPFIAWGVLRLLQRNSHA